MFVPRQAPPSFSHQQQAIIFYMLLAVSIFAQIDANPPMIHFSHNMRILKIPIDTPIGTVVYRIKATDADNDTISFGVLENDGRRFLKFIKINDFEANVILVDSLNIANISEMNLTIYANDSKEATYIDSKLMPTPSSSSSSSGNSSNSDNSDITAADGSCSVSGVITVSNNPVYVLENATFNESIVTISARSRDDSKLPVIFELMDNNVPFQLENIFAPNSSSKARLFLVDKLDYERQNLYIVTILAINARTNEETDTRNVHSIELSIVVRDVPDTAPIFHNLPSSISVDAHDLLQSQKIFEIKKDKTDAAFNQALFTVNARDGDQTNQRNLTFRILEPYNDNFDINSSGKFITKKSYDQLALIYSRNTPIHVRIQCDEVTTINPRGEQDQRSSISELIVILINTNRAPKFGNHNNHGDALHPDDVVHSSGGTINGRHKLEGFIDENSPSGTIVQWNNPEEARLFDFDEGFNGTVSLFVEHPGSETCIFRILPEVAYQNTSFVLVVNLTDSSAHLDYETKTNFTLKIIARDHSKEDPLEGTIDAVIHVRDVNDHVPQFSETKYRMSVYENAPIGTVIGQVHATDIDSGQLGAVRYRLKYGNSDIFKIDTKSGTLTVASNDELDREKNTHFTVIAEAIDTNGNGSRNQTEILITVLDLNDNAPVFLQSNYLALLADDRHEFLFPVQVTAIDVDELNSTNSFVNYEILHGNYDEQFGLDRESGELTVKKDTMKDNPAVLTVRAYDHGIPQQSSTARIHIYWRTPAQAETCDNKHPFPTLNVVETVFRTKHKLRPSLTAGNDYQLEEYLGVLTGGNVTVRSLAEASTGDAYEPATVSPPNAAGTGQTTTTPATTTTVTEDGSRSVPRPNRSRRGTTSGTDIRTVIKYSNRSIVNLDAIGETLSRLIYTEPEPDSGKNTNEIGNKSSTKNTRIFEETESRARPSPPPPLTRGRTVDVESAGTSRIRNENKVDHDRIDSVIRGRQMTDNTLWTLPQFATAAIFNLTGLNIVIWILLLFILIFLLLLIYLLCLICCHKRKREIVNKLALTTPASSSSSIDENNDRSVRKAHKKVRSKKRDNTESLGGKFLEPAHKSKLNTRRRMKRTKVFNGKSAGSSIAANGDDNQSGSDDEQSHSDSIVNDTDNGTVVLRTEKQYKGPIGGASYYEFKHVKYPRNGTERTINILSLNEPATPIPVKSLLDEPAPFNEQGVDATKQPNKQNDNATETTKSPANVQYETQPVLENALLNGTQNRTGDSILVPLESDRPSPVNGDDDSIEEANQRYKDDFKANNSRRSVFAIAYDKIRTRNTISSGSEHQLP